MRRPGVKWPAVLLACCAAAAFALVAVVPTDAKAATPAADEFVYHFRQGDTLIQVGRRLLREPGRWRAVQVRNGIANPLRIRPGTPLRIPLDWLRLLPVAVKVGVVSGNVRRPGGPPIFAGESLAEGALVETGPDGAVTLHLDDGSIVTLQKSSTLGLERLRKVEGLEAAHTTRLKLESGRVETTVKPASGTSELQIATPIAVSAVRGTRFRASYADAAGTNETLEGAVDVSNALAAVGVPAGFGTRVERDRPPLPPRPLLPAPSLSALPAVNTTAELALSLPPVEGARQYRVQIATDAAFQSIVADRLEASTTVSVPLADARYWVRTRAIDAQGIEGLDAVATIMQARAPDAPVVRESATAARVAGPGAVLRWDAVERADSYRLQVARDASFAAPAVDQQVQGTSFAPEGLSVGPHVWRVAARREGRADGPWSELQSFVQRPAPPVVVEPILGRHDVRLSWSAVADGPWRVQVARDAQFERVTTDVVAATPAITIRRPFGGTWHVRVQALDAAGVADPFGPAKPFEVPLPTWAQVLVFTAVLAPAL